MSVVAPRPSPRKSQLGPCHICGKFESTLRRVDAPMTVNGRKFPKGTKACYRHFTDYRGLPGAHVPAAEESR